MCTTCPPDRRCSPSAPSGDARRRRWRSSTRRPPPWSGWGRQHGSKPPCSASASSPREECGKATSTYAAEATRRSGARAFIRSHYGGVGTAVSALATQLERTQGIRRVTGSVDGDESYFDSLRGEPSSGYASDPFLEGNLSALAFNRGETGRATNPRTHTRRRRTQRASCGRRCGRPAWWCRATPGGGAATDPAGGDAARGGALADDRAAARLDAAAIGQLLRGDATQGPRGALWGRRHHSGGGARGARNARGARSCTPRWSTARGSPAKTRPRRTRW